MNDKSVAILVRDPLKKGILAFEIGYWRFSEYLVSECLLKNSYQVIPLPENAHPLLWKFIRMMSKRDWVAEYIVCLLQSARLAFAKNTPPIALAWQGPGFVFAAIRKLLRRTRETRLIIIMYYSYPYKNFSHALTRFALHKILYGTTTIVCITPKQENDFVAEFKLRQDQIRRITRGIDTGFFLPTAPVDKKIFDNYVFCSGEYNRDDPLLLRACKDLDICLVRVTKEPDYAKTIEKLAKNLGFSEKTRVFSKVTANTLRSLIINSLFVALPLNADTHPAGLTSLLEGMSCGKAVIVTRGLTSDYYTAEMVDALHCERNNLEDLKNKMKILLDDECLREKIGTNARNSALNRFRIEDDVNSLMRIIEEPSVSAG